MTFDFDTPVDIANAHASKHDFMRTVCEVDADDGIPMWVADMDFAAPDVVRQAVANEIERGFLGYYGLPNSWREAQCSWLATRHGWQAKTEWLTPVPGIMFALATVIQRFSEPGDSVAIFSPVYHEFAKTIIANDRNVHNQPMIEEQGRYRMDVEGLGRDMPGNTRIVVLCSPQNPGGRVWTREELREVAEFCIERDLILISDEIHGDLVYSGSKFIPAAVAAPEVSDRLVTLCGATKAFNIAGAKIGTSVASNPKIKRQIDAGLKASGTGSPNRLGMAAVQAALESGAPWLDALIPYLENNRDHFAKRITRAIPGVRAMHLEATFLAWTDFSATGLTYEDVWRRITKKARIGVSPGPQFGPGGENRIRFNIATHYARLNEALDRLEDAFSDFR
ncbi:MAG: MalY/PatB family protein [Rhizobiaceae bacterium]